MKTFIAVLSLLFCLSVHADPPVVLGSYSFSGQIEAKVHLDVQVVHALNDTQRARLEKLRADGYECWYVMGQTARCTKVTALTSPNPDDVRRLNEQYGTLIFDFGSNAVAPVLTGKGEILSEWDVSSPVHVGKKVYPGYHLIDYANSGSPMIKLSLAKDWYFYFTAADMLLKMVVDVSHTLKTGYSVDTYELIFKPAF